MEHGWRDGCIYNIRKKERLNGRRMEHGWVEGCKKGRKGAWKKNEAWMGEGMDGCKKGRKDEWKEWVDEKKEGRKEESVHIYSTMQLPSASPSSQPTPAPSSQFTPDLTAPQLWTAPPHSMMMPSLWPLPGFWPFQTPLTQTQERAASHRVIAEPMFESLSQGDASSPPPPKPVAKRQPKKKPRTLLVRCSPYPVASSVVVPNEVVPAPQQAAPLLLLPPPLQIQVHPSTVPTPPQPSLQPQPVQPEPQEPQEAVPQLQMAVGSSDAQPKQ